MQGIFRDPFSRADKFGIKDVFYLKNDLFYYIHLLAAQIQKMEEKLAKLERENSQLKKTVEKLTKQPPIHIERIDYHFDQLKIEQLEGTLNIGINPKDLQNMDELAIPAIHNHSFPPQRQQELADSLLEQCHAYLENDLTKLIEEKKTAMQIELDESYMNFIKEDIKGSCPTDCLSS